MHARQPQEKSRRSHAGFGRPKHAGWAALFGLFMVSITANGSIAQEFGATPANGGRITGKVIFSGEYRPLPPLAVVKNRNVCGLSVADETFLVGRSGRLANAVVTLQPLDRKVSTTPARNVLDNRHCAFVPHVQVATVGSELILKNSDPILHTVHARLGKRTLFHVGLPQWRQVSKRLAEPGVMRIDCDVLHTWMSAVVVVVATPHYAVTDGSGGFVFNGLEPGAYGIEVWHERLGRKQGTISVAARTEIELEFVYANAPPK